MATVAHGLTLPHAYIGLQAANPGDVAPVGAGLSELRIHYGLGYRVYFMKRGKTLIVLLYGGDKTTLSNDIKAAQTLAADLKD